MMRPAVSNVSKACRGKERYEKRTGNPHLLFGWVAWIWRWDVKKQSVKLRAFASGFLSLNVFTNPIFATVEIMLAIGGAAGSFWSLQFQCRGVERNQASGNP